MVGMWGVGGGGWYCAWIMFGGSACRPTRRRTFFIPLRIRFLDFPMSSTSKMCAQAAEGVGASVRSR